MADVDTDELTALGRFINHVVAVNGWSQAQVSKNAEKADFELSQQTVSKYKKSMPSVNGYRLKALAAGLRQSESRVARAAMESFGITMEPGTDPESALLDDADLSAPMKRVLLAALEAAREEARGNQIAEVTRAGEGISAEQERRKRQKPSQRPTGPRRSGRRGPDGRPG